MGPSTAALQDYLAHAVRSAMVTAARCRAGTEGASGLVNRLLEALDEAGVPASICVATTASGDLEQA